MKARNYNNYKGKNNVLFVKNVIKNFAAFFLLLFSLLSAHSQDVDISKGKSLFNANCAACHKLNKNLIGPALAGVSEKYEREWLYTWIKNSSAMIKSGDERAVAIWEEWNKAAMNAFPQLSNEDIDDIPFKVGDSVKVIDGPFKEFNGLVQEVNDRNRIKVNVNIFGRPTPIELSVNQILSES